MSELGVNRWIHRKILIPGKLVFAYGHPTFRPLPRIVKWGTNISVYWLGAELIFLRRERP